MEADRRRFIRARARLVTWLTFPETGRTLRVLTLDISAGGARFMTDDVIEVGTPLTIELKLPDREEPVRCTAEVVRSIPMPNLTDPSRMAAETAVKFSQIDPRDHAEMTFYAKINLPPS